MADSLPLVSIVTVNYGGDQDTIDLLLSLQKISYSNVEVIVVDNASPARVTDELKNFSGITFIQSTENLGFAGGNNLGIEKAKGDFIFLLNNDTLVEPGFLEPMVDAMLQRSDIGLLSPKIIFHNRENRIQYAGSVEISEITSRGFAVGFGEVDAGQHHVSGYTARPHGAAMLIRRSVIEKIGMLPLNFFLYYEEMDFSAQAIRAGFKVWFEAGSTVYHKESMSVGKHSPIKAYYLNRNRMLYVRRNVQGLKKLPALLYLVLIVYPTQILRYAKAGQFSNSIQVVRGLFWNLTHTSNHC